LLAGSTGNSGKKQNLLNLCLLLLLPNLLCLRLCHNARRVLSANRLCICLLTKCLPKCLQTKCLLPKCLLCKQAAKNAVLKKAALKKAEKQQKKRGIKSGARVFKSGARLFKSGARLFKSGARVFKKLLSKKLLYYSIV
jgi:hypothetical protein